VSIPLIDLRALAEEERLAQARLVATVEAQQPFDLARGPLLRVALVRLNDQEQIAQLTLHHIVADGWSIGVLIRELAALYEAFQAGRPAPLPELAVQYTDFAVWQRRWLLAEGALAEQLGYWRRQLAGAPTSLDLPTDRPRPALRSFQGRSRSFSLPAELAAQLKELRGREGVTLFMLLLAAFQVLLHRYSGQADIVVGSPVAGRNRSEIEPLIGFFVNTLALRGNLSGNPGFRELLGRVREVCLGAYAHQDLPFERLVTELQLERDMSRTPLFQVLFELQSAALAPVALPGLSMHPIDVATGTAKFDLTLSMNETRQGLQGLLEYSTDLFEEITAERLLAHFQVLLQAIVADPSQPIATLPLLTEAERRQLLAPAPATADTSPDCCIQQLFEQQAARCPDAIAIVFERPPTTDHRPSTTNRLVPVFFGHAEPRDGVAFEVELDQHGRFVADHVAVVAWGHGNDLRCHVRLDAAVRVLDFHRALHEEADMRVHAVVGADVRLRVDVPAVAGRVDHPLDASVTSLPCLEAHAADVPADRRPTHVRMRG
jgi:non-ribosomal peptide synthetase component F